MKKGNLYYYFRNKEEILFACHQYSLDRLTQLFAEIQQTSARPDQKAATTDRCVRSYDSRRAARHGAISRSGGADAGALEDGDRPARSVRSWRPADYSRRNGGRRLRIGRPEAAGVCAVRRGELDSALVQPERTGDLAGNRRSVRGLSDRGVRAYVRRAPDSFAQFAPPVRPRPPLRRTTRAPRPARTSSGR